MSVACDSCKWLRHFSEQEAWHSGALYRVFHTRNISVVLSKSANALEVNKAKQSEPHLGSKDLLWITVTTVQGHFQASLASTTLMLRRL